MARDGDCPGDALAHTEDRLEKLGSACADEPGESEDLPPANRQVHRLLVAGDEQASDIQGYVVPRSVHHGEKLLELPADHRVHDVVVADLLQRLVHDHSTVTKHDDAV